MLTNIYNETITIFNKLKRVDGVINKDIWYKTVLTDAAWYKNVERNAAANSVYLGEYHQILIPFHDNFLPYDEWKNSVDKESCYTMSTGDYIVRGIVNDIVTADNIVKTMEAYGERVCLVKYHEQLHKRFSASVQLKIEGV